MSTQDLSRIDHLILGAPTREEGMAFVHGLTGVEPAIGGQHPQYGTCNALLSLGEGCYLEIIAPDPSLPDPGRPRLFGLDELTEPRLVTWVANAAGDIRAEATEAVDAGVPLGPVEEGGRRKPDGSEIRWTVTDPYAFPLGGAVPFLIEWGGSVHPSTVTPGGLELLSLTVQHPDAQAVEHAFSALGLPIPVQRGEALRLEARLRGPGGEVSLS